MWNQQARTSNNSCQYRTLNKGVQPPQSASFTFHNGIYPNGGASDCQTPTISHLVFSSQEPAGGETNSYYQKVVYDNQQNSSMNTKNGHPVVTNGFQVGTNQSFHQHPGLINSLSPANRMNANTIYPQQNMSAHCKQAEDHGKQLPLEQDANVVPEHQNCRIMKSLLQNGNGQLIIPISAYNTPATSLPHKQVVFFTANNRKTPYNQHDSQTGTQHVFYSPVHQLQSCTVADSQSQRNNSNRNKSNEQISQFSSMGHKTQQHPDERQMILRIADDLRNSFPPSSNGCPPVNTSSSYSGTQFVRMSQNESKMQPPVLNVSESCTINALLSLPLSTGLSLSKTNHSVISKTEQRQVAPQKSSVPNTFVDTAAGDGHGAKRQPGNGSKATNAIFLQSNRVSKGNPVELLTGTSQMIKLPECISLQTKTTSCVANKCEMLQNLTSAYENDNLIQSSPGRSGTRAVAIVQPLSGESYQAPSQHITSDAISKLADNPVIELSAASFYGTPSSNPTGNQDVSQKHLPADDTECNLANNKQGDKYLTSLTQQLVTSEVPISQSCDEGKSLTDPKTLIFKLSSIPTVPWTIEKLNKLILHDEKGQLQLSRNLTQCNSASKLLNMYWERSLKNLTCKLKEGWYRDLITYVSSFCSKHIMIDSVILSQVKGNFEKQLQHHHVLKHNDIYSEKPYKSPWLNVNEQLDDIDKEFGFPWSLKRHILVQESHSVPNQVCTVNSIPDKIVCDLSKKVSPQTEFEPVDTGEEKQPSSIEFSSMQAISPNEMANVNSSDPYYSFKIQVLPPEEAKIIFEHVQGKKEQSMDTDSHGLMSVMGKLPQARDVALKESKKSKQVDKSVCPIQDVCCISRWVEHFLMSKKPFISNCQCKNELSCEDDTTFSKKEASVQREDNSCATVDTTSVNTTSVVSDEKSITEGENQVDGGETYTQHELCSELSQPIYLSKKDHKCHCSINELDEVSKSSSRNQVSTVLRSEKNDKDLSGGDAESLSDPEVDCVQVEFKSKKSMQSCISVSCNKDIETPPSTEIEVASHISDCEENHEAAKLTSATSEPSLETELQTQSSEMAAVHANFSPSKHENIGRKRKRSSSPDSFCPIFKKSNKCKPVYVDSQPSTNGEISLNRIESEALASNVRAVQLVLFGSAPQENCLLLGSRERQFISLDTVSDGVPRPPKVLSVALSPLTMRRQSSETILMQKLSIKQKIYEKWRRSFPPTSTRSQRKQKCSFLSGGNLKRTAKVSPTVTEQMPFSSEVRIWNLPQNTKRCLRVNRRRSLYEKLKQGKGKTDRTAVSLNHINQERGNSGNESHDEMHVKDNSVLRFNVLPKAFNFKDISNQRKEANDLIPDLPAHIEEKSSNRTVMKRKGTWYQDPEKQCPRKLRAPKLSGVFQEFQKKYMEKTQPTVNE